MKREIDTIGLVGAGLIGGSIAMRLARTLPKVQLLVHDLSRGNAAYVAERHPAGKAVATMDKLTGCDVIFVATPVSAITRHVEKLLRQPDSNAVIIDTGSAKSAIVQAIADSGLDAGRFVPGHPLAGGVSTGPGLSSDEILTSRPFVITPSAMTDPGAVITARTLLEHMGAHIVEIDATEHDKLLALGSHLPHLISFALAGMVDPETVKMLPASFRGVSAFAASDPQMWSDIFCANTKELRATAEIFKKRLDMIVAMADEPAPGALLELLAETKAGLDDLEG